MTTPILKHKIAICVSGQTRQMNEDQNIQKFLEALQIFENEFEVDYYGHTWADQEDPDPIILNKFREYKKEDQSVIWDTITAPNNIVQRDDRHGWTYWFQTKESWMTDPEYRAILDGTSDTSYIDFAKERIYGTVGQIWSAHQSFNLVKDTLKKEQYKAVIRLRWDTSLQWNNGRLVTEQQIERFKQQLHDWIDSKNDFAQYNCCCLVSDQAHFRDWGIPFFNDFCFVFRPSDVNVIKNIIFGDIMKVFKNIFNMPHMQHLHAAHSLWAHYLIATLPEGRITPMLPNIFTASGTPYKSNKRWGI